MFKIAKSESFFHFWLLTPSKSIPFQKCTFEVNKLVFTGWPLFSSNWKVKRWFNMDFNFIANLYKYQVFKSIPLKLTKKNNFDGLLLTESLCSIMSVHSPKPWDTKHGLLYFRFTVDRVSALIFFISLMCVWLKINYCIVYLYTRGDQKVCGLAL